MVEKQRTVIPTVEALVAAVDADPRVEIVTLDRGVFDRSLSLAAIPELHDRLIVATALLRPRNGSPPILITKDEKIVTSGLVPTLC